MGCPLLLNIQCPRCGGAGKVQNAVPASDGEGGVVKREPLDFRIKAGTRDGQRIRLAGKGNAGINGGPAGDLFLIIKADPNPTIAPLRERIYGTVPGTTSC